MHVVTLICTFSVRKFCMQPDKTENKKGPKTDLDKKFIYVVEQAMSIRGIQSDRAMSIELERHPNFINRVRNGLQSAPPDAWDALFDKYPAARSITTTNVMAQGGGQAVGAVHGDNHYSSTTLEACQLELEQHKRDLAASRGEVEQLRQQVASQAALLESKDALIAAKDETISLLRGGYNRPN
jgi:hypothetical protein